MIPHMNDRRFLTGPEAAQLLGVTRQAISARVKAGTMTPVYHTGTGRPFLFAAEDVEALVVEEVSE